MPGDARDMSRRRIAASILLKMIDSPGAADEKVYMAVKYTDMLLKQLKGGRSLEKPDTQTQRLTLDHDPSNRS